MSIEQALADNTAAIRELIAKISHGILLSTEAPAPATKVEAPKPAATQPAPATATPTPAATAAPEPVVACPSEPIKYDDVFKAITALVKTDKTKVLAVLSKFSAKRGPDLKAEQYSDFLKALAS